jgi:hypothetical protein
MLLHAKNPSVADFNLKHVPCPTDSALTISVEGTGKPKHPPESGAASDETSAPRPKTARPNREIEEDTINPNNANYPFVLRIEV